MEPSLGRTRFDTIEHHLVKQVDKMIYNQSNSSIPVTLCTGTGIPKQCLHDPADLRQEVADFGFQCF